MYKIINNRIKEIFIIYETIVIKKSFYYRIISYNNISMIKKINLVIILRTNLFTPFLMYKF